MTQRKSKRTATSRKGSERGHAKPKKKPRPNLITADVNICEGVLFDWVTLHDLRQGFLDVEAAITILDAALGDISAVLKDVGVHIVKEKRR